MKSIFLKLVFYRKVGCNKHRYYFLFVVTTIKTTTYSTATTVTDAKEHDSCPDCLRKDFAYVPKKLLYQPITGQLISEHKL